MYRPVLVTAPALAPLTLADVKAHCRVDFIDDDDLLVGLIAAATALLDGWTGILGRCLCEQSWRQDWDLFGCRELRLPLFPVISIASVAYEDAAGASQTVAAADYKLLNDECGAFLRFAPDYAFPAVSEDYPSVHVTYLAGYATDTDATPNVASVPAAIKQAMLLLIGAWYENREQTVIGVPVAALPRSVASDALLAPFRRVKF